jgi:hypothetical protein
VGLALWSVVFVFVFAGCSSAPEGVEGWAADFEAALAHTDSAYIRQVLDDHLVTADELRESNLKVIECLNDRGIEATLAPLTDGETEILEEALQIPDQDEIGGECYSRWGGDIPHFFRQMKLNPGNENWSDLVAACLVRTGVVPDGFTGADFDRIEQEWADLTSVEVSLEDYENGIVPFIEPTATPTFPGGALYNTEEVAPCQLDPRNTSGSPGLSLTTE